MQPTRFRFTALREEVSRVGLGIALLTGLMGQFVTFVPGAQEWYFGVATAFAAVGLVSRSLRMRIVAAALAVWLAAQSRQGHLAGLEYREFLRTRSRYSSASTTRGVTLMVPRYSIDASPGRHSQPT